MWSAPIVPADRSQENTRHKVVPLSQSPCRCRRACLRKLLDQSVRPHACEGRMSFFRMSRTSSLHPASLHPAYGHLLTPLVLIGIGILVLQEAGNIEFLWGWLRST